MIKLYKIPLKSKPLRYIRDKISDINSSETLVLVPTKRNVRELSSYFSWQLDIQTVSEFISRAGHYSGVLLPKELRSFYMYKAISQLSNEDISKVLRSKDHEMINYINFLKKSSAILPFYRELAAEGIDWEVLKQESLYQDYEDQVNILSSLWEVYCGILHGLGYMDSWEYYKEPILNEKYLDRYVNFVFLSSGYLAEYEILQLKSISLKKNLDIYFNFIGESHHQQLKLEKFFGVEFEKTSNDVPIWRAVENASDLYKCIDGVSSGVIYQDHMKIHDKMVGFPYDIKNGLKVVEIIPSSSFMDQFDLITRRICEEHFNNNVPLSKMAVILPSSRMLPWFNDSDRFMLFNVSEGRSIKDFTFFQHILNLSETVRNTEGGALDLNFLEIFVASGYFEGDFQEAFYDLSRQGALYIEPEKLKTALWHQVYISLADFLKPFSTYPDIINALSRVLDGMLKSHITLGTDFDLLQIEGIKAVLEELDKLNYLYQSITDYMPSSDILSSVLSDISSLSIPEGKGSVSVIGILESRNLQFDYIFVPDLNSDVFPSVNQKDFFLNTRIRIRLGLPTLSDRESLQKNYLYQIVSRSKRALLTYTESEDMQASTFIGEIMSSSGAKILDHSKDQDKMYVYNPEKYITLPVTSYKAKLSKGVFYPLKDDSMKELLFSYTYSATRLECYRSCPMQFFFRYVKKLRQREEPVRDADMRVLGEKLHRVMHILFERGITALSDNYLDEMRAIFLNLMEPYDYFSKNAVGIFQKEALVKQFDLLAFQERERLKKGAAIKGFEVTKSNRVAGIKISCKIDRLDATSNGYDIIDYKYKRLKPLYLIKNFDDSELQLPLYSLVMERDRGIPPQSILWFDLKGGQGFINGFPTHMLNDFHDYFENFVQQHVLGGDYFLSTNDPDICKYCSYKDFCPHSLVFGDSDEN